MDALLALALKRIAPKVIKRYLIPLIETRLAKRGVDVDLERVFDLVITFEQSDLTGEERRRAVLRQVYDLIQEHGESYVRILIEMALARARSSEALKGATS